MGEVPEDPIEFSLKRLPPHLISFTKGKHPVDAGINFIHEQTDFVWKHSQSVQWQIRYKCWRLNFRKVTEWATRLLFLDAQNMKKERGLTSQELGKDLKKAGLVPVFWEPHPKQPIPNIIGDLQILRMNMIRLFPGKYSEFEQDDVCDLIGKRWCISEDARAFLIQEYGESYKQCIRKLEQNGPGQTRESLLKDDNEGSDQLYSGSFIVQILICSSLPDQMYCMLRVTQLDFDQFKCEVLNSKHYTLDRGDGSQWLYFRDQEKVRYGRWVKTEDETKLKPV